MPILYDIVLAIVAIQIDVLNRLAQIQRFSFLMSKSFVPELTSPITACDLKFAVSCQDSSSSVLEGTRKLNFLSWSQLPGDSKFPKPSKQCSESKM